MFKMKRLKILNKVRIRHKLLISYSLVLILTISMGSSFIYFFVQKKLTAGLESELNNTTTAILNLVRTSVTVSIQNHLRAVAEKNIEIIQYFYDQQQEGALSDTEAREMAANLLLTQKIGDSGYIYCLDSDGNVPVHPQASVRNTNVFDFAFVRKQLEMKKGYVEYEWKNPGEKVSRPKALYMLYFEPWDWIVSVSSYRKEFMSLVNVDDFKKSVLDMRFGKTGYAFVMDGKGNAVIHPKIEGVNIYEHEELPDEQLIEMHRQKSGQIIYDWKNPDETVFRSKLTIFNYIPEFDWVVGSCSYLDELFAPLRTIRTLIFATAGLTFLLVLPLSLKIGTSITTPLKNLTKSFDQMISGDFSTRMAPVSNDEIGQLVHYYNRFADQIESYRNDLTKQMEQQRQTEEALRQSEARYRTVMESAPDPIVVYDMNGLVTYFNPAFTRVFGWSLTSCMGNKMDHFVPEENWDETNGMIATMLAGETLSAVPTSRYTKDGSLVEVSISGSTFRNHKGALDGSVVILRDVTKSRRLQQQVMDIGDQVRRRIGQDLHDDLCPHLIGVHGMSTVLAENLVEVSSPDVSLAQKVVDLVGSAIEKARALSRGLCPVHLVSHGFVTSLEEIARKTEASFHVNCRLEGDDDIVLADNTVATHLYYIVQEAVQNAVKHADADKISIRLNHAEEKIHLQIVDNGKGIPSEMKSNGIGLQIMQYRAKIINAAYQITSNRDNGTVVSVSLKPTLPVKQ
jgi:PAS domain S-box-containing protein